MKQFSLDEYIANSSKKVVTRDGRAVKIICTDAKGNFPVIGLIADDASSESPHSFTKNGKYWNNQNERADSPLDLFFASEKHERWINLYKIGSEGYSLGANIYIDKEHAETVAGRNCVATIKIEWEE